MCWKRNIWECTLGKNIKKWTLDYTNKYKVTCLHWKLCKCLLSIIKNFGSIQNSVQLFTHRPGEHRKLNIYNDQILMESVLNLASLFQVLENLTFLRGKKKLIQSHDKSDNSLLKILCLPYLAKLKQCPQQHQQCSCKAANTGSNWEKLLLCFLFFFFSPFTFPFPKTKEVNCFTWVSGKGICKLILLRSYYLHTNLARSYCDC